jgi:uncharacterized RDD family membrane protein YckC
MDFNSFLSYGCCMNNRISKTPPSLRFARFGWRFFSWLLDQIVLAPLFGLLWIDFYWGLAVIYVLRGIYYTFAESSQFQATLGKYWCGLVVTNSEYDSLARADAAKRYIYRLLSCLTGGIGFLMMMFTRRKQTLHDAAAKTFVLKL